MNPFMCVLSCLRDQENGCNEWFRNSIKPSPIPYKIFLGEGCTANHADEIVLPINDSYPRLPWKVQSALNWVLKQDANYTHILKTDCDTQVWLDRLLSSNFAPYDYVGNFADGHHPPLRPDTFAFGAGYWLSRSAAEKVVSASVESTISVRTIPPHDRAWAEDEFVGTVLNDAHRCHDEKYMSHFLGRSYNGATNELFLLGNTFPNKTRF